MLQWERLKKAGMAPGPRASFGLAAHKKRAVLFGGITDQKGKVSIYSPAIRVNQPYLLTISGPCDGKMHLLSS